MQQNRPTKKALTRSKVAKNRTKRGGLRQHTQFFHNNSLRNDYDSYASIRSAVFNILEKTPDLTVSEIKRKLMSRYGLNYENTQVLRNYKCEYFRRRNRRKGFFHNSHHNVIEWNIGELAALLGMAADNLYKRAMDCGWRKTSNRNAMLVFRCRSKGVSFHMFRSGRVRAYVNSKCRHLGDLKTAFCKAFFSNNLVADISNLESWFESLRVVERHRVFPLDVRLPSFEISFYRKSRGIVIKSDGSHPRSIEVVESEPHWVSELKALLQQIQLLSRKT